LLILDICVIISWIAYHEFQPSIIESFGLQQFTLEFTIWSALIIISTPAIVGIIADKTLKNQVKDYLLLMLG